MSQILKPRTKNKQQNLSALRSVGAKPCDFHKLKYTTSYRSFNRKSLPHLDSHLPNQPSPQVNNFDLKLLSNSKDKQQKVISPKKTVIPIDKWKQRYCRAQQNYYPIKKSQEYFPMISSRNTFYPKQKLIEKQNKMQKIIYKKQKQISPPKIIGPSNSLHIPTIAQRQSKFQQQMSQKIIFQKYEANRKQINENIQQIQAHKTKPQFFQEKKSKFALDVDKKINDILKVRRKSTVNLFSLKQVEQRPDRWQIMEDEEWGQQNGENYQSNYLSI